MWRQSELTLATRGRGTTEITDRVAALVRDSGMQQGLCHLFLQHTSASIILCENADQTVREDLEGFAARLAPDGDARYRHDSEGPDDMAAHLRTVFSGSDLSIPVGGGRLLLGTWQGIFLWEHRTHPHARSVVVTLHGE